MSEDQDFTPQERAALVTWRLAHGEGMQTRDVAELTGLTMVGAWYMMQRLARVIPIYQDERGVWAVCAMLELEYTGIDSSI